jgi:hypothetical protein
LSASMMTSSAIKREPKLSFYWTSRNLARIIMH